MNCGISDIDHVVCSVADPQSAGERLAALGFVVTPLSIMDNVGVANRLILFQPLSESAANFIELMGVTDRARLIPPLRPFLPEAGGYRWLVLSGRDAAHSCAELRQRGYAFGEPVPVQRDWTLPSGEVLPVAFNVMMPIDAPIPFNFCEYRTLQHYRRPEFLAHPNGAQTLTAVMCCADGREGQLAYFEKLFDARPRRAAEGIDALTPGRVELQLAERAAWERALNRRIPPSASLPYGLLGCRIKVRSLTQTTAFLRGAGLAPAACELGVALSSPLGDGTCFVFHD